MKKILIALLLTATCFSAFAQSAQLGTFSGRLMRSNGNLLVLYNEKADVTQQLMINPSGQRGRDLTLLYNYCETYCVVKGFAIRAPDYNNQFEVFWLTRLTKVFNPQTPEANDNLLQGQNNNNNAQVIVTNDGKKIIRREGGQTDDFMDYENNRSVSVALPQY